MNKKLTVAISEDRTDHSAQQQIERGLLAALAGTPDVALTVLPHLYDLAPDGPGIRYLRSVSGDMVVLAWLYPRATYWILDANRVQGRMGDTSFFPEEELPSAPAAGGAAADAALDRTIWCIDLRGHNDVGPLVAEIDRILAEVTGAPVAAAVAAASDGHVRIDETTRRRWYPVVDYGRCGHCLECLNFCLFGVFGLDEAGKLLVEQPDACRDGCPACSRVCPASAIMFPQHDNPAIAGDPKGLAEKAEGEQAESSPSKPDGTIAKDQLDYLVDELDKTDF